MLCFLLLLALARPPHQGELVSRAVLVYVGNVPRLQFTFQSRAPVPVAFSMPTGTPLTAAGGEPVYLGSPLEVRLKPGERKQLTLPVIAARPPGAGVYEPSGDRSLGPQVRRVHQVLAAGESHELAAAALLPPEDLAADVRSRLTSLNLAPLPSASALTGLDLTGDCRYTFEAAEVTLLTPNIRSKAPPGANSGPLRASVCATRQGPYAGGEFQGHRLSEWNLGAIQGGGVWPPLTLRAPLLRPPSGRYSIVFLIEEQVGERFVITHWGNFPGLVDL